MRVWGLCLLGWWAIAGKAALIGSGVTSNSLPWPGGVIPYQFDPALSAAQQQAYLNALRDWELAGNLQFVPRTAETQYIIFKYDPFGPNLVSPTNNPQIVEVNLLTRGQIGHEMGHSLGLLHEHSRTDRDTYVTILTNNISPGDLPWFAIEPTGTIFGSYDFESVLHSSRNTFSIHPDLDTVRVQPAFAAFQTRLAGLVLSSTDRAAIRHLYGPGPTLTNIVTTTADTGPGSLRAAMFYAADHPGTTIRFEIPLTDPGYTNGVFVIRPTGHLPPLTVNGTVLDGASQPGFAGQPLIVLDGSLLLPEAGSVPGLLIYAAHCTVQHLAFRNFPWVGVALLQPGATNNTIRGCWIGLDHTGATAAPNVFQGIQISDGASHNTIGGTLPAHRNVIAGNTQYGIWIAGSNTTGNLVLGNYIGLNATGTAALPNQLGGLILTDQTRSNIIGGAARNIISGNTDAGIWITGPAVRDNLIQNNFIGLNPTGTAALPNTFAGILLLNGATSNTVADNVISGNASEGIRLADPATAFNLVTGNRIGTDPTGATPIPNGFAGLTILAGANRNTIGGGPGLRNLIAGNATYGLVIGDSGTDLNTVLGNTIGLNATATAALPNGFNGLAIWGGARSNLVGGITLAAANLIAGNASAGVALYDAATFGNCILANSITSNGWIGISLNTGANLNRAAPTLTAATLGLGTTITGSLTTSSNDNYRIEFFASPPGDDEGATFLGATNVLTSAAGLATIQSTLPAAVPADHHITATATDPAGNTSPFSIPITVTTTDTDTDTLPDAWETFYFTNLAALPDEDTDGDGFTNARELRAGTDPRDSTSRPFIHVVPTGNATLLRFPTQLGVTYRLEYKDALTDTTWLLLADQIPGTGAETELTDPTALARPHRFYRLRVLP